MEKSDKWYKGNKGCRISRSRRERSLAGLSNPKETVVSCISCGKDTSSYDMLCEDCK